MTEFNEQSSYYASPYAARFEASVEMPTGEVLDLTPWLLNPAQSRGATVIRQAINPLTRDLTISTVSITLHNSDGYWSPKNSSSPFYGLPIHGLKVHLDILLGAEIESRTMVRHRLQTGIVDQYRMDDGARRIELLMSDPTAILKNSNVPHDMEGDVVGTQTPAAMVREILRTGYLGLDDALIDLDSFDDADAEESSAGITMTSFALSNGSWWSSVQECLQHGMALLRPLRDGRLAYFRIMPGSGAAITVASPDGPLVLTSNSRAVRNQRQIQYYSGGSYVDGDLYSNALSIATFQLRQGDDLQFRWFATASPANVIGGRQVDIEASAADYVDLGRAIDVAVDSQVGEYVAVTSDRLGVQNQRHMIVERSVNLSQMRVDLVLWDNFLDDEDWLYTNNSQKLDDGQLIW